MRIGLLFGSFNPIHVGHLIIGQFILNQTDVEEVWFVVSPQNPLKSGVDLYDENDRLQMVKDSIVDQPKFIASDIEFDLPRPSYTFNTLQALAEKYEDHEFVVIMGADNLLHFDKWKEHEQILLEHEIFVYHRDATTGGDFAKNQKVRVLKGPMLNISSTLIRSYKRMNKSVKYMVPKPVEKYLDSL